MSWHNSAWWIGRAAVLCPLLFGMACRRPGTLLSDPVKRAASQPSTRPVAVGGGAYRSEPLDLQLTYPTGWVPKADEDYALKVVPADGPASASISLEVPPLPPHVPGMIPVRMVKNGYIDDLKTSKGPVATTESSPTVPKAGARLVRSTWTEKGRQMFELALILVHADKVYILRADGMAGDELAIKPAFDAVSESLHCIR